MGNGNGNKGIGKKGDGTTYVKSSRSQGGMKASAEEKQRDEVGKDFEAIAKTVLKQFLENSDQFKTAANESNITFHKSKSDIDNCFDLLKENLDSPVWSKTSLGITEDAMEVEIDIIIKLDLKNQNSGVLKLPTKFDFFKRLPNKSNPTDNNLPSHLINSKSNGPFFHNVPVNKETILIIKVATSSYLFAKKLFQLNRIASLVEQIRTLKPIIKNDDKANRMAELIKKEG